MANSILTNSAAGTNVTTAAYVQLTASTLISTSKLNVTDTTGKIIKLAIGAAGFEVDLFQLPVSASQIISLPSLATIPPNSRLSLKAIDANATTGYTVVTLIA